MRSRSCTRTRCSRMSPPRSCPGFRSSASLATSISTTRIALDRAGSAMCACTPAPTRAASTSTASSTPPPSRRPSSTSCASLPPRVRPRDGRLGGVAVPGRHQPSVADLRSVAESEADRRGRAQLTALWPLVDARAESVGESVSRAVMRWAGFEDPELQRRDHLGRIPSIASTSRGAACARWASPTATRSTAASTSDDTVDRVIEEKRREDRLRRACTRLRPVGLGDHRCRHPADRATRRDGRPARPSGAGRPARDARRQPPLVRPSRNHKPAETPRTRDVSRASRDVACLEPWRPGSARRHPTRPRAVWNPAAAHPPSGGAASRPKHHASRMTSRRRADTVSAVGSGFELASDGCRPDAGRGSRRSGISPGGGSPGRPRGRRSASGSRRSAPPWGCRCRRRPP